MNWAVFSVSVRSLQCSLPIYTRYITASLLAATGLSVAMAGSVVAATSDNVSGIDLRRDDLHKSAPQADAAQSAMTRVLASAKVETVSQASVARNATAKSHRGRNKIITPIIEGFAELRNPVALFIAAKNRLLAVTHFRMTDSAVIPEPLGLTTVAPLDVTFGMVPSYELTTPTSTAVSRLTNAIDQELHPGIAPDRPLPLVRSSATQLNMRVNDAVSFLWEVDRNESPVNGSEVGMGIGFKVAF